MAIFEIVEGAPGQGKSLYTARLASELLERNRRWESKGNQRRPLYSNIRFSEAFESKWEGYIFYWTDISQLIKLNDCDIIWDEIATDLDARNWPELTPEFKRFLSQYRKRGVDIYANTQDFSMIDVRARLMISGVKTLSKIIGSGDISSTKPAPKVIWGLVLIRTVENFRETSPDKKKYGIIPSFMLITRELIEIYDTRQDIKASASLPRKRQYREVHYIGGPKDGQIETEYSK